MSDHQSSSKSKMCFTRYEKNTFQKEKGEEDVEYEVGINPDTFTRKMTIQYVGNNKNTLKTGNFQGQPSSTYSFSFVIDGTGATGRKADVKREIDDFKKAVYDYIPQKQRPPFVKIAYCGEIFRCVLDSLDITYSLFYPDGYPLRAKVTCSFSDVINLEKDAQKKDAGSKQSSGTVCCVPQENERPLAVVQRTTERRSGDCCMDRCIEVAESNQWDNIRCLPAGEPVYCYALSKP